MKEIFSLSLLYCNVLIRKKFFILYITLLLIISFFLIPNANANYVTFYIGDNFAAPNQFWIGSVSAIFSNVSIYLLLLFVIIGEKNENYLSNNYVYEATSPFSQNKVFAYKIIALFIISLVLLLILNFSIILINFSQINLYYYCIALIYFSVPFLLFVSVLCFLTEYLIKNNTLKYFFYYIIFLIALFNDKFINLFGINELGIYLSKEISTNGRFGLGYLQKNKSLNEVTLTEFIYPLFILKKLVYIAVSFILIYFTKLIPITSTVFLRKEENLIKNDPFDTSYKARKNNIKFKLDISLLTLLKKDIFLFINCINKYNLLIIIIIWGLMFFVKSEFYKFLLPLMFILCLFTNTFLYKLYYYNIEYLEKISPFSSTQQRISKFIIIFGLYLILLLPYLIHIDIKTSLLVILFFIILTIVQIIFIEIVKSRILIDIILIILFATYFTGSPVLNIFLI